jgi:hypothetical protein
MLSYLSDAFSWGHCVFSFPRERKAASRIVMRKEFGILQSFTIESSFGGIENGPRAGVLYDETIWKEMGGKCGEAVYHLVARDSSPLCAYVEKEFALLSPPAVPEVEEAEEDQIRFVDVQFASLAPETPPGEDLGMRRAFMGSGQPSLLKLRQPTTFLVANSRIISTTSPGYVAPKWTQMQFTPK